MTTTTTQITSELIEHGRYRTFLSRSGSGPALLLLHGSGPGVSALANWATTLTCELAEYFTLMAPDIAGFGATTVVDGDLPVRQAGRVEHVADLLRSLGLGSVAVVGNSMGGGITARLALEHPELVSRMILMGSSGMSFELTPEIEQLYGYEPSVESMRGIFDLMAYDASGVPDELVQARYEASTAPGVMEQYRAMFGPPRQRHIDDQALTPEELGQIDVPTLLIHGAQDRVVPVDRTSLQLVRHLPNADLLVLGRCGHWTQVERAAAFRQAVLEFLGASSP